jgi:hypothetical protein
MRIAGATVKRRSNGSAATVLRALVVMFAGPGHLTLARCLSLVAKSGDVWTEHDARSRIRRSAGLNGFGIRARPPHPPRQTRLANDCLATMGMNTAQSEMRLADRLEALEAVLGPRSPERFDFRQLEWNDGLLLARGARGYRDLKVSLNLRGSRSEVVPRCSVCGPGRFCTHVGELVRRINENGVAEDIDANGRAACTYELKQEGKRPVNAWKSQLNQLARQFEYYTPSEPVRASFPVGREAIYVLQSPNNQRGLETKLEIELATRPVAATQGSGKPRSKQGAIYRPFNAGLAALRASADPLDREVAEKLSLTTATYGYLDSRQQVRLSVSPAVSGDIIARLAQSGRLFYNAHRELHDQLLPLGWICDDKLALKFEISALDEANLSLGVCAAAPSIVIAQQDLKVLAPLFLIDANNRLGLFHRMVPSQLITTFIADKPMVIPRVHANELIEQVMGIRLGLGVEFNGCEEIRPARETCTPRPTIHIKAPAFPSETLEADVQFDYDGVKMPLHTRSSEFYDKRRRVIVPIDTGLHERSSALLTSLGVKRRYSFDGAVLSLPKKKLPGIVGHLIYDGWHVEADGKLYRTGSRFDLSIVSGIDWFELQGKAHFDQTAIDLPRLLTALRAGEKSVVLDDGSVGLIPETWLKQFGGLAELGSSESGSLRFGKSQVGLLDALLAEQAAVNVDEKFTAARQSLQAFDCIRPQEPPEGFVGTLRPYQKLAQGWFEFLRNLGFGGCLADDMGLGTAPADRGRAFADRRAALADLQLDCRSPQVCTQPSGPGSKSFTARPRHRPPARF